MLLSVHVPKTGGRLFQSLLGEHFGERLLADYRNWVEIGSPVAEAHNAAEREKVIARLDQIGRDYDAIHGHFRPTKYLEFFPDSELVCFVRDPFQHAISMYEQARRLVSKPLWAAADPGLTRMAEERLSIFELIEAYPNLQSYYLGGLSLDRFGLIGITERYEESLDHCAERFGLTRPASVVPLNTNPDRTTPTYDVSPDLRRFIERRQAEDIELYRRACERFDYEVRRRGS